MPSLLGRKRTASAFGRGRSSRLQTLVSTQVEVVGPPWGGFVPDLDPNLTTLSDAESCTGIISRGGQLMADDGFERVDGTRLPLGGASLTGNPNLTFADANPDTITRSAGSWVTDGFVAGDVIQVSDTVSNDGTYTIDAGGVAATVLTLIAGDTLAAEGPTNGHMVTATPPATTGNEEPVVGLPQYLDNNGTAHRFAITANADLGHLYELSSSVWTNRNYTGTSTGLSGNATNPEQTLVDWAYYPLANFLVFTNDEDVVFKYPNTAGGSEYTEFGDHDWGGGNTTFRARSVAAYGDRLVFLNTVEGATDTPYRVRWTNINSSPDLDPTVTGTGHLDLVEVESDGLKLLPLGDVLAVYFEKAVVFLRRTLIATQAFSREFVTTGRGLLSPFSAVDLGNGIHFGVFNDGWFFLDSTGRWLEAGVRDISGKTHHKWKDNFFEQLNWDNKLRVNIGLDRTNRFIRISFPTGASTSAGTAKDPDTVWIYDVEEDTVWPDTYGDDSSNIWGNFDDQVSDTVWSSFGAGDVWSGTSATWNSFGFRTGRQRPVHGTTGGVVLRHAPDLLARDGLIPSYSWVPHTNELDAPGLLKTTDRLHMVYLRTVDSGGGDPPPVTLRIGSEDNTTSTAIQQNKGSNNTLQTDYIDGRHAGNRVAMGVSGQHPVRLSQLQLQYHIHGLQEKKD